MSQSATYYSTPFQIGRVSLGGMYFFAFQIRLEIIIASQFDRHTPDTSTTSVSLPTSGRCMLHRVEAQQIDTTEGTLKAAQSLRLHAVLMV